MNCRLRRWRKYLKLWIGLKTKGKLCFVYVDKKDLILVRYHKKINRRGRIIIIREVFRTIFLEKYFSNDARRKIIIMQLKQRIMSVWEYVSNFDDLENYSTFIHHLYERMKCIKFENGLRLELRKIVWIL